MAENLTWIDEDRILACPYPSGERGLAELRDAGVRFLINLSDEAHAELVLDALGITELHLPVADFTAPSQDTLERAVAALEFARSEGQISAVHCVAGLGRTGTVLAAWLVARGHDAGSAIARIRELRPGSIETAEQEKAIHEFARRRGG